MRFFASLKMTMFLVSHRVEWLSKKLKSINRKVRKGFSQRSQSYILIAMLSKNM